MDASTEPAAETAGRSPESGPEELVVLLNEQGAPIGTAPKATVHTADTPLHRAFSCYVFGGDGHLLLTRRARTKATFPDLWTNTVCGHPGPGETDLVAITRRTGQELRLTVTQVTAALPSFRYRAQSGGIVENEVCPVYLARAADQPDPDPDEVQAVRWASWAELLIELDHVSDQFSPWCLLQARELEASGAVSRYLQDREPAERLLS